MMKNWKMLICVVAVSTLMGFTVGDSLGAETPKPSKPAPAAETAKAPAAESVNAADTVAVTVNGQKIMASTITNELNKRIDVMKKRMSPGQALPETQLQQMHMRLTDSLVDKALTEQMAKEQNVTVTDDQVTDQLKQLAGQRNQTMEDVEKQVQSMGMTLDDVKTQLHTQMLTKGLVDKSAVSDDEVKKFYDENPQYFEKPEQVHVRHILVKFEQNATDEDKAKAKEKIEGLLKRAKAGEDFAALAKEYTDDPGSKDNGGEYTFPRGRMVKPFEDAAFALKPGEISDVVETQYGYHIIKLLDKIPAGKVTLDEAKEKISNYLKGQKFHKAQQAFRDKATIVYSDKEQKLRDDVEKAAKERQAAMIQQQAARQRQQQAAGKVQVQPKPQDKASTEAKPAAESKDAAKPATEKK